MLKKILLASLLSLSVLNMQATEDPFLQKNNQGQGFLHCAAMFPENPTTTEAELDESKSIMAAFAILEIGLSVDEKDKSGTSPLDLALSNKKMMPKLLQVMQAGKVYQDFMKNGQGNDEEIAKSLELLQEKYSQLR